MIPFLLAAALCGQGTVTVDMTFPLDCERIACMVEQPPGVPDTAYRELCGYCRPGYGTWGTEAQTFTDRPGPPCYGARVGS